LGKVFITAEAVVERAEGADETAEEISSEATVDAAGDTAEIASGEPESDDQDAEQGESSQPAEEAFDEMQIAPTVLNPGQPLMLYGHGFKITGKGKNYLVLGLTSTPKPQLTRKQKTAARKKTKHEEAERRKLRLVEVQAQIATRSAEETADQEQAA